MTAIRKDDLSSQEEEIIKLRSRLDLHIDDYRAHILEEERRYLQEMQKQAVITANIESLMKAIELQAETSKNGFDAQIKATEGLVNAWNVLSSFQKFVKWMSGFAAIGVFIAWYNDLFTK